MTATQYYIPSPTILFFTNLIISRSNNDNSYKTKILPLFINILLPFNNHEDCLSSLTTFNFEDFYVNSLVGIVDYFITFNNYLLTLSVDLPTMTAPVANPVANPVADPTAAASSADHVGEDNLGEPPEISVSLKRNPRKASVVVYGEPTRQENTPLSKLQQFQQWTNSEEQKETTTNDTSKKTNGSIQKPASKEQIDFDNASKTYKDLHTYITSDGINPPDSLINSIKSYFEDIEKNIPYDIDLLFKAYIYLICQDCINYVSDFNNKNSLINKDEYFRFVKFWVLSTLISQL